MPAGYSGTPLAKKLGIKDGHVVSLVEAPAGFESLLEGLPASVALTRASSPGLANVTVAFFRDSEVLAGSITPFAREVPADGPVQLA